MGFGCVRQFCRMWELPFTRSEMLLVSMVLIGGTSLFFACALELPYDARLNFGLALFLALCAPFVHWPRCYGWVANLLMGSSLVTIFLIAMQTGGINSMSLMWLIAMPVLALLLMDLKKTAYWFLTMLLSLFVLHYLTVHDWISGRNAHVLGQALWGVLTVTVLTVLLMVGVQMHDYLHQLQIKKLEASNEELRKVHESLMRIQNLRDEFVAAVGHELRTPMNAILGFNGVLRDQMGQASPMVSTVNHIQDATHQLLRLVNDILDFSQLQAGKMPIHKRPCALRLCLAQASVVWQQAAQAKGIEFAWQADDDLPYSMLLDDQKFNRVLDNLVGNAIKFTSSGRVILTLIRRGDWCRVEVSDTGPGISLEVQRRIFNRFERADLETNRKHGGTGLGLAICEGLVQLQGGRIGVLSHEGDGAMFWVEIPFVDAQSVSADADVGTDMVPMPADTEFSLLLVDDNKINLMVAEIQLLKAWPKLKILSCLSAAEALAALNVCRFDVALVDMVMPEIDGVELTRRLRRHKDSSIAQMPIVAFTANVQLHEKQRCLDAGMNDVLTKPMDEKRMVLIISDMLRQSLSRGGHATC
jgi:signal transduction histidine kinase/ActR/RegA family two-component response regulator